MSAQPQQHADLARGEGEWRNMQPVLRNALLQLFDTVGKQHAQIQDLCDVCSALRTQLALRPTHEDLREALSDKQQRMAYSGRERADAHSLTAQLSELKVEVQRKASVQYVDDCQRRKLDRSEAVVRHLVDSEKEVRTIVRACVADETRRIQEQLGSLSTMQQRMLALVQEAERDQHTAASGRQLLTTLQGQVAALEQAAVPASALQRLTLEVDKRASQADVQAQLGGKVDRAHLATAMAAVERALQQHERQLAAIRLRPLCGGGGGDGEGAAFADAPFPSSGSSASRGSRLWDGLIPTPAEPLPAGEGDASGLDGADLASALRGSRDEALLQALWQQAQRTARDLSSARQQARQEASRVDALEAAVQGCAGAVQCEALSVIVEEHKLRLDALIQGQIQAEPVLQQRERLEAVLVFLGMGGRGEGGGREGREDTTLRALLEEQREAAKAAGGRQEALVHALQACGKRLGELEAHAKKHAKAIVGLDAACKEEQGDLREDLTRQRAAVDALARALQRQQQQQKRDHEAVQDLRARPLPAPAAGLGGGLGAGMGMTATGEALSALGAAAVDARLAVLQSEKARLRQQL